MPAPEVHQSGKSVRPPPRRLFSFRAVGALMLREMVLVGLRLLSWQGKWLLLER